MEMQMMHIGYYIAGMVLMSIWYELSSGILDKWRAGLPVFAAAIAKYEILPASAWKPAAVFIMLGELSCAVLLVVPQCMFWACGMLAALGMAFVLAQLSAMIRGMKIECGCRGDLSEIVGFKTLLAPLWFLCSGLCFAIFQAFHFLGHLYASEYWFGGLMGIWIVQMVRLMVPLLAMGSVRSDTSSYL
jgi:Methylamine utilisation protein MauE